MGLSKHIGENGSLDGLIQSTIYLSAEDYEAFVKRLDEPPKFNQRLADLLNRKSVFDVD
jgi:uncharacterized protein (DUF1778 family)